LETLEQSGFASLTILILQECVTEVQSKKSISRIRVNALEQMLRTNAVVDIPLDGKEQFGVRSIPTLSFYDLRQLFLKGLECR
jgi:hypothetical protein